MNLKINTFRILDSLQDDWPVPLVILSHSKVGEWESHSPAWVYHLWRGCRARSRRATVTRLTESHLHTSCL